MKLETALDMNINYLYHYQSFNKPGNLEQILNKGTVDQQKWLTKIFTDGTIRFSEPSSFNDPWDCCPCYASTYLDVTMEYERVVNWFLFVDRKHNNALSEDEHLKREHELRNNPDLLKWCVDQSLIQWQEVIKKQYRIYCLSTHPDLTLMWGHYGNSCKGICLEYSVHNELFCSAYQVDYLEQFSQINIDEIDDERMVKVLLSKSFDWKYEDEFRLIATEEPYVIPNFPQTRDGFLQIPKDALKSVIVGCSMSASDRDLVRALVKGSGWNVELKEACRIPNRYKFDIRVLA